MSAPIVLQEVSHAYGRGALRRNVLHEVSAEINEGEVVLFTGPSGSGKTTLLTLVGALRSAQEGSLTVLGRELRGAGERRLVQVRRQIGYVFQAHNLLESLTARENVEVALQLHPEIKRPKRRARSMLESVGLADHVGHSPRTLSGGQRQRVAIARALVTEPKIVLADEPTASLDKKTGREVIELLRNLAREHGVTVVVVTHDNRILDTADRVLHLEDGRLSSPTTAVMRNARTMMGSMAQTYRSGEVAREASGVAPETLIEDLQRFTDESRRFRNEMRSSEGDALTSMLEQVLEAFSLNVSRLLNAEKTTIFLVDGESKTLWSVFASGADGKPLQIHLSVGQGIAGRVAATGQAKNTADAYDDPDFDRSTDEATGFRTRSVLCLPVCDGGGRVIAVIQVLNKGDRGVFDSVDQQKLEGLVPPIGAVLQSWVEMGQRGDLSSL